MLISISEKKKEGKPEYLNIESKQKGGKFI